MVWTLSLFRGLARSKASRCVVCGQRSLASKAASAQAGPSKASSHPPSILKAGTVMKGLSVLKDQPDPIALPDEEYPDWVWTLTDAAKASGEAPATPKSSQAQGIENGFDFKAERRKLRQSNREGIKGSNLLKST